MSRRKNTEPNPTKKSFQTVIYPEDLPENFFEELAQLLNCKIWVSPVHDRDKFQLTDIVDAQGQVKERFCSQAVFDGYSDESSLVIYNEFTPSLWLDITKKPHYHVVFCFDTSTRLFAAQNVLSSAFYLAGFDIYEHNLYIEPTINLVRSIEYLIHFNEPNKAQYLKTDIQCFNGANFNRCFLVIEEAAAITIMDLIIKTGIDEYNLFYLYLRQNFPEFVSVFINRNWSAQFQQMIKSNRHNPIEVPIPYVEVVDIDGEIHHLPAVSSEKLELYRLGESDKMSYVKQFFIANGLHQLLDERNDYALL